MQARKLKKLLWLQTMSIQILEYTKLEKTSKPGIVSSVEKIA